MIKQDKLGDYIADMLSIPAELRTTPEERAVMQEQMLATAQAVAEQQGVDTAPIEEVMTQ